MCSELECGICYRPYNTGRRCPRELHCKHSFCERCLVALSRPSRGGESSSSWVGQETSIVCPLCRQVTSIPGDVKMTAVVRVDECIFDRILSARVLEDARTFDQDDVDVDDDDDDDDDREEVTDNERPPVEEETDPTSGGKFRRSLRRAWKKITGHNGNQTNGAHVIMSNDDLKDLTMMWCHRM